MKNKILLKYNQFPLNLDVDTLIMPLNGRWKKGEKNLGDQLELVLLPQYL